MRILELMPSFSQPAKFKTHVCESAFCYMQLIRNSFFFFHFFSYSAIWLKSKPKHLPIFKYIYANEQQRKQKKNTQFLFCFFDFHLTFSRVNLNIHHSHIGRFKKNIKFARNNKKISRKRPCFWFQTSNHLPMCCHNKCQQKMNTF